MLSNIRCSFWRGSRRGSPGFAALHTALSTKFKAYDGTNNIFNLAYEILSWKVHRALIKAKLGPYLGFLHSTQFGKPSVVCDFQELYRYLIDDFLIGYCKKLERKDFILKTETLSQKRKGKRQYLNNAQTMDLTKRLHRHFEFVVEVPRIRTGKKQTIETLINEEALLLAKFLRGEKKIWIPRIARALQTNPSCNNNRRLPKTSEARARALEYPYRNMGTALIIISPASAVLGMHLLRRIEKSKAVIPTT